MLAMHGVAGKDRVIQKCLASQHRDDTDAAVDQNPECSQPRQPAGGHHGARMGSAEDHLVEDEAGRENHASLETAAGAEIAVKLNVETIEQDERYQQFDDGLEDQRVMDCTVVDTRLRNILHTQ